MDIKQSIYSYLREQNSYNKEDDYINGVEDAYDTLSPIIELLIKQRDLGLLFSGEDTPEESSDQFNKELVEFLKGKK